MPVARNGTIKIHWKSVGQGPAVLLIAGQRMTVDGWWATIPVLARSFRVIAFDHRDTGRSSQVPWSYSVSRMAEDALAVLDATGEQRAHVYGVSLGGLVAQELALRHPDRVHTLVLGATTAGGLTASFPAPMAMTFFARAVTMGTEEVEWAAVPYTHSDTTRRFHADRIAANIAHRVGPPTDSLASIHQAAAVVTHTTYDRLHKLSVPTLVVHGEQDLVVPPANAVQLADRIPGARLRLWPDAGHLYIIDEPRADQEIARFLLDQSDVWPVPDLTAASSGLRQQGGTSDPTT